MEVNNATDKTEYAKMIGYKGEDKVMVLDGVVISHENKEWMDFCHDIRYGSKG